MIQVTQDVTPYLGWAVTAACKDHNSSIFSAEQPDSDDEGITISLKIENY
jgi:hypothetical protein